MKILVAGAQGQFARALAEAAQRHGSHQVVALGRPQLDLLDHATIAKAMADVEPDLVVNAAAYTAVDKAESDTATAFAVNRDGAGALAAAARASDIPIIHVSTDYVFDGRKIGAYVETDATNPLGVYGKVEARGRAGCRRSQPSARDPAHGLALCALRCKFPAHDAAPGARAARAARRGRPAWAADLCAAPGRSHTRHRRSACGQAADKTSGAPITSPRAARRRGTALPARSCARARGWARRRCP